MPLSAAAVTSTAICAHSSLCTTRVAQAENLSAQLRHLLRDLLWAALIPHTLSVDGLCCVSLTLDSSLMRSAAAPSLLEEAFSHTQPHCRFQFHAAHDCCAADVTKDAFGSRIS